MAEELQTSMASGPLSGRSAGRLVLATCLVLTPLAAVAEPRQVPEPHESAAAADESLPLRNIDRPTTLAQGVLRLDADLATNGVPSGPPTFDGLLGFGYGLLDPLEIGAQAVPVSLSPTVGYTQPSVYASWGTDLGSAASVAPNLQVAIPAQPGDTWLFDVDANAALTLGPDWELSASPSVSLAPGDALGSSLSMPVGLLWQSTDRFFVQAQSGIGLDTFDVRRQISHSVEPIDFKSVVVPVGLTLGATVGREGGPLSDLQLQAYWPQLYVSPGDDMKDPGGFDGADWTVLALAQTALRVRK